eukprot:CAMPEP_0177172446 /NCGR_PEP_ID=MMETSP0367-20130122/11141_1 /TAXON_ID=447022 ORGANISM="Scrippsiella hangoei-like, Strain SHHI-4" /NCGR_SAMPLE_ID=MMETSP0367 /ASSEMBLY_ACC=CAM_ASM_000362 /LENGTH=169 /DNA_ID=CAMNT_0018618721 /DNA_START=42 /DNA_END=552 /DNA_ORIENTATION=-
MGVRRAAVWLLRGLPSSTVVVAAVGAAAVGAVAMAVGAAAVSAAAAAVVAAAVAVAAAAPAAPSLFFGVLLLGALGMVAYFASRLPSEAAAFAVTLSFLTCKAFRAQSGSSPPARQASSAANAASNSGAARSLPPTISSATAGSTNPQAMMSIRKDTIAGHPGDDERTG